MKVLVTGSSGFIGTHLVKFLKKKRISVLPFDLKTGQNLFNKNTLEKSIKRVDYIIHLAAIGDVYQAERNPQNALRTGIIGTQNLIEVANKYPIKKIVYASTWEVYGKLKYQPIDENHPCNPNHPYSIAKLGGELVIRSLFNKINWIILRLGTVYGINMRNTAVIPVFIKKALKKEPITIHGTGNQIRQFIHIDDLINVFYLILEKEEINNQIFNIVGDEIISVNKLANIIIEKIPTKIIKLKKREGEPFSSIISNKKIKKLLKWEPKIDIKSGIYQLIEFYSSHFSF